LNALSTRNQTLPIDTSLRTLKDTLSRVNSQKLVKPTLPKVNILSKDSEIAEVLTKQELE